MKKGLKIAAAGIGIPLGAVLIAGLIVPGLPAKMIVKTYCVNIDKTASPSPYDDIKPQDDWKRITAGGMTMLVPPTVEAKDDGLTAEAGSCLFSDSEGSGTAVLVDSPQDLGTLDLQAFQQKGGMFRLGLSEPSVQKFLDDMGKPPVNDYAGLMDVLLDMNTDTCNIFSLRKASAFTSFAFLKEIMMPAAEDFWKCETENGTGFLLLTHSPQADDTASHYTYSLDLFEKQNGNAEHRVMVMAADTDTCLAILNTAEIVNEAASAQK